MKRQRGQRGQRRTVILYVVAGVMAVIAGVFGDANGQVSFPLLAAGAFCFAMAVLEGRRRS